MTTYNDEFYRDMLEGLSLYTGSAFQRDVLATLSRHDEPRLGAALNKSQMASKMWLADALLGAVGPELGRVRILGGWVGVLAAVLLHDPRFSIGHVESIDIDPACAPIAEAVNATHVRAGRFAARTADMLEIDCGTALDDAGAPPDLVVNTSCEHLSEFDRWYAGVPERAARRAAVERLLRVSRARELRARPRRVPGPGADDAACCSPASGRFAAMSASC